MLRARTILAFGITACAAGIVWLAGRWTFATTAQPSDLEAPAEVRQSQPARGGTANRRRAGGLRQEASTSGERIDAAPPALESQPDSEPAWVACLDRGTPEDVRDCLERELPTPPDPAEVARYICATRADSEHHSILLAEALYRSPAAEVLEWISRLEVVCPPLLEWGVLEHAIRLTQERDPAWFKELRSTLTADRLFDPDAGQAGILLSSVFLEQKDLEVRGWMELGARGEWGGTREQIDRAIAVSLCVRRTGEETLLHLQSVLASNGVPGGGSVGSTFVHALLRSSSWPDGDSRPALDTILLVLYEPRFQESAAATVCLSFPVDPPQGCDPTTWAAIRTRSLEIADQIHLVIPGRR